MISGYESLVVDVDGHLPIPDPHEDAGAFCRRAFGGRVFPCRRCGTEIGWPGVCDRCDERRTAAAEAQRAPKTVTEVMAAAGVPRSYVEWVWTGCVVPTGIHLGRLRSWDGEPPLLTLVGPTGTGKTGVAVCFVRDWALNGSRVRWLYVPDWLDELRWLESEGSTYHQMQNVCLFAGLLVLDEIATRRITDYGIDRVLQVLDARTRKALPTIITSNLPTTGGNGLAKIDERIASRIEAGNVITWAGRDLRKTGR